MQLKFASGRNLALELLGIKLAEQGQPYLSLERPPADSVEIIFTFKVVFHSKLYTLENTA